MNDNKDIDPARLPWLGRKLLWLDDMAKVKRLYQSLIGVCVVLIAIDFVYPRYGAFEFELIWGFYAFYGFAAFSFIIFTVKLLRKLVGRDENYYSPSVVDAEEYPEEDLGIASHFDD